VAIGEDRGLARAARKPSLTPLVEGLHTDRSGAVPAARVPRSATCSPSAGTCSMGSARNQSDMGMDGLPNYCREPAETSSSEEPADRPPKALQPIGSTSCNRLP